MKKQSMYVVGNIFRNRVFVTAFVVVGLSGVSFGQTRNVAVVERMVAGPSAVVKHIGNPPGSAVFQVQYDNPLGEKFTLTIKDNEGTSLYQDTYTDKKFDKKFQLPEGQSDKLQFIIKSVRNTRAQVFEVSTNTRVIEEVVVKRVG